MRTDAAFFFKLSCAEEEQEESRTTTLVSSCVSERKVPSIVGVGDQLYEKLGNRLYLSVLE